MGQGCSVDGAKFLDSPSGCEGPRQRPALEAQLYPHSRQEGGGAPSAPQAVRYQRGVDSSAEPALPTRLSALAVQRRRRAADPTTKSADVAPKPVATASSSSADVPAYKLPKDHWRRWYRTSHELGSGVSAAVYGAQAVNESSRQEDSDGRDLLPSWSAFLQPTVICTRGVAATVPGSCLPDRRRQVAIKRFKKLRSRSFQTELAALLRVGVHPHIIRLFESYEDCDGEDVLILEYCEGSTVFDVYAKARRDCELLPELLVARLVRQLLLALEHILACGIEHQDVKPENMLLYNVSLEERRAELKLGDFGWAVGTAPQGEANAGLAADKLPADGAGSLWYAPPELNPPVEALGGRDGHVFKLNAKRIPGRSDMWSVGVVVYLLLVGQNPFSSALMQSSTKAMEAEVIRQVALGQYDATSARWLQLPQDARDFVGAMLQVPNVRRLSACEALRHPYLMRRLRGCAEVAPLEPAWRWADRDECWSQLDGFQRLGWAAMARAAAEPELQPEVVVSAARSTRANAPSRGGRDLAGAADAAYLWQLAREMCAAPIGSWLKERAVWIEVAHLAFRYLDVDRDGLLGPQDLVSHVVGAAETAPLESDQAHADSWSAAHAWIVRWSQDSDTDHGGSAGVTFAGFRSALCAAPGELSARDGDCEDFDEDDDDQVPACIRRHRNGKSVCDDREEEILCWPDSAR